MSTTRILCLHGYHGSAAVLRRQMGRLAAHFPADVELVLVDAPSLSSGDFGWWHDGLRGWERTREWITDLLASQRFDGVFGFSQGAALAGMLAAIRENDSAPIDFDLALMVGGFTSTLPQHAHLFTRPLAVPSLHVVGRRDGKPTLVVQGGRDPFGRPDQFPALPPDIELVEVPGANHMFGRAGPSRGPGPVEQVTEAVVDWLNRRLDRAVRHRAWPLIARPGVDHRAW